MKKLVVIILSIIASLVLFSCIFYNMNLKAVGGNKEVIFKVDTGGTYYTIIDKLKKSNLIRNELCFKLYVKFNKVNDLQAGSYKLNTNMSVNEIIDVFNKGNTYNPDAVIITFNEGLNMRSIAGLIEKYTDNKTEDVYNLLKDTEYLNSIIDEYWFIDETIKDINIYYSLEGYLYPNTYEFKNKSVTVREIFKAMLDEMDKQLTTYKTDLLSNELSIHELLTLSSIVELEGKKVEDRDKIARVFYNRLNTGMSLGSDVTTYYGAGVDMSERDLYEAELNDLNAYNTRSSALSGKLPIGPICNSSIESVKSVLYPDNNEYLYFLADKNGKVYYTKTYEEHISKRSDLIEAGLWYTYN